MRIVGSNMVLLSLTVATGLGVALGFSLGRMKSWLAKHEVKEKTVSMNSPLLKTRLRVRGIAVKGIVK